MIKRKVQEIVEGRTLARVTSTMSVDDAARVLADHNIGATVVMEDQRLLGILSERDVIRRCICAGKSTAKTSVGDIMTAEVEVVDAETSVAKALEMMLDGGFRHLPVTHAGTVTGMLSMRDIPTENRLLLERYREAQQAVA